ncbi:MAG: N-acetylmuramoyl-L-alanine amidase [Synechococcales bacterium]|nr:N-acetylmuramoyl-L-alanine amidase [Synechococcales bacterium]
MRHFFTGLSLLSFWTIGAVQAQANPLQVVYPSNNHETTAAQIFLIGTAPIAGEVLVNGKPIARSAAGHFAPSFPLQVGENRFTLQHPNSQAQLTLTVIRKAKTAALPTGLAFGSDSLEPGVNLARLPGDRICFGAIAPAQAQVSVSLGGQTVKLQPQNEFVLPENSSVLTGNVEARAIAGQYVGCTQFATPGELGNPRYRLTLNGQTLDQSAPGKITILSPSELKTIAVTAAQGVARTGPSTDYSRLTPLPKGSRAQVTGQEGNWWRLDYGAWIRQSETIEVPAGRDRSLIRGVTSRVKGGWTEVIFPLQFPVPVSVQQGDRQFTVTLHNTIAQTDTVRVNQNPVISGIEWQQTSPSRIDYQLNLKAKQQWGYQLRYEGTRLIVALRHPPQPGSLAKPLQGMRILLDPGHGGPEDFGARGPTGLPEKEVVLTLSQLLRQELIQRGATVLMTREADIDLLPNDRAALIQQQAPTIALSLHYNALPDDGDALKTQGVSVFWYHPQAQSLAIALHDHLTTRLNRPSDGVMWNNLALTRPNIAPSVLLELGYMIHPTEFEWIRDPQEQQKLATAIADSLVLWFAATRTR